MSHPSYDGDLYTDEALLEPYEHYRTLRDLGSAVWLTAHEVYAVTRYEDVRSCLIRRRSAPGRGSASMTSSTKWVGAPPS
jgi:cytochrome P450